MIVLNLITSAAPGDQRRIILLQHIAHADRIHGDKFGIHIADLRTEVLSILLHLLLEMSRREQTVDTAV